jgi:hypothetical protein
MNFEINIPLKKTLDLIKEAILIFSLNNFQYKRI